MNILIIRAKIRTDRFVAARPAHVRGFFSNWQPDNILLHQHQGHGENHRFVYMYPRVQYRVSNGSVEIIGLAEGTDAVLHAIDGLSTMVLKGERYNVLKIEHKANEVELDACRDPQSYRFASPWLALSQKNYQRYQQSRAHARGGMLQRILIGNILSMCKSLGIHVSERLSTSIELNPRNCYVKQQHMLGFEGGFSVNFVLPERLGIGHLVSIGFGEVTLNQRVLTNR